jgi:hypothetical protein
LALDEYAVAMQAVETSFGGDASDPGPPDDLPPEPPDRSPPPAPPSDGQYPLGGDLVAATVLFSEFDRRLDGWRAIDPPLSVAGLHDQLVDALDAIQRAVGDYLGSEAMAGTEFEFSSIGDAVAPLLRSATTACLQLRTALQEAGADVDFAGNCEF